ncbi:ChaN family lipoprotein [Ewingella americana]|uniref:Uncharacterized iron-regulated protein n=2 Tax=Ewingella americana TaxID=41202 RepID=A0A377N8N5_9GAMM|nr:ChaN family lipoprotein [Ewingella americana]KAA8727822.1 iron-regulated protein [Ewingella americana]KFC79163.1 putative lipoprotein [Ewingella americana ATCC 33852]STQ43154.1 Uncharacterized iron-regulated protein [Ewingella americana]
MKKLLIVASLLLAACAQHPTPPSLTSSSIKDLHTGESLTPEQLLARLAKQPRVIVGEKHDNPAHHQIEAWLVESLPTQRPQGSVLMEMLTPSQQPAVESTKRLMQTQPELSATKVAEQLKWQKSWDWSMYSQVVMPAIQAPYPLLAANLDRSEIMAFYQKPAFPAGANSADPQVREAIADTIKVSHQQNIEPEQLHAMLAIQQQRDRRMAERLLAAPTPALLIVGGYHAKRNVGVPVHVRDLQPEAQVTVLMLAEQGAEVDKRQADYLWITAAAGKK